MAVMVGQWANLGVRGLLGQQQPGPGEHVRKTKVFMSMFYYD